MNDQVVIYARDMIAAQGATLTAEHRAILTAKADRFRALTETTEKTLMRVPVRYIHSPHEVIGSMSYYL